MVARGTLRSLAALSVAGRHSPAAQNLFTNLEGSVNASFAPFEPSKVSKNVYRGFAAEAEPVAAAGKGAITQVGYPEERARPIRARGARLKGGGRAATPL